MEATNEATYITVERRQLAKLQRNAKSFASQYRKYRAQKSELAEAYKIMAKHTLTRRPSLKKLHPKSSGSSKKD